MTKPGASQGYMINILVLHRIVAGRTERFEDVTESILEGLLSVQEYGYLTIDESLKNNVKDRRICLTFDDGNSSDYERAYGILNGHNAHATFFVVTDWLNRRGFLGSSEIRELHGAGMQIGSHSVSHCDFRRLSPEARRRELEDSRKQLEDVLGASVTTFAFPYGFENGAAIEAVFEAGYERCCTSRHGVIREPTRIMPRNSINAGMSRTSVFRALEAKWGTRWLWKLEDAGKAIVKRHFASVYPGLRSLFSGK